MSWKKNRFPIGPVIFTSRQSTERRTPDTKLFLPPRSSRPSYLSRQASPLGDNYHGFNRSGCWVRSKPKLRSTSFIWRPVPFFQRHSVAGVFVIRRKASGMRALCDCSSRTHLFEGIDSLVRLWIGIIHEMHRLRRDWRRERLEKKFLLPMQLKKTELTLLSKLLAGLFRNTLQFYKLLDRLSLQP